MSFISLTPNENNNNNNLKQKRPKRKIMKKRSWVWYYYKETDKEFAVCDLCNTSIKYISSTNNLMHHLNTKHEITKENTCYNNRNDIIDKSLEYYTSSSEEETDKLSHAKYKKICTSLVRFIAGTNQPILFSNSY